MRTALAFLTAAALLPVVAGDSLGQRGRIPIFPRPALRPPRFTPVLPHHVPHIGPHTTPKVGHHRAATTLSTGQPFDRANPSGLVAVAASTVGMMASADGQGAFAAASALAAREAFRSRAVPPPWPGLAVVAASTVGMMGSADGQGAFAAASALAARDTIPPVVPPAWPHWNVADELAGLRRPNLAEVPREGNQGSGSGEVLAWIVVGCVLLAARVALSGAARGTASRPRVRITTTPTGEAPVHVRRAWVGLELPLAPGEDGPSETAIEGVLSHRPEGEFTGYVVTGSEAVQLVGGARPGGRDVVAGERPARARGRISVRVPGGGVRAGVSAGTRGRSSPGMACPGRAHPVVARQPAQGVHP